MPNVAGAEALRADAEGRASLGRACKQPASENREEERAAKARKTQKRQEAKAATEAANAVRFANFLDRFLEWWIKIEQEDEYYVQEWCHGPSPWGVAQGSAPERRKVQEGLLQVRRAAAAEEKGSFPIQEGEFKGLFLQDVNRLCKTLLLTKRGGMEVVGAVCVGVSGRKEDDLEVEGRCEQLAKVARKAREAGAKFIGSVGSLYIKRGHRARDTGGKSDAVFVLINKAWGALADLGVEVVLLSVDDPELMEMYCRLGAKFDSKKRKQGKCSWWVGSVQLSEVRVIMLAENEGFTLR